MKIDNTNNFIEIMKNDLVPALGCTEPIAIAYAFAKAREVLGEAPQSIKLNCSGNIIKNVQGVVVPNSGGLRGIDIAATLGVIGGNAQKELEVLTEITAEHIREARSFIAQGLFECEVQENVENLYISASVFSKEHTAVVTIINRHTLIAKIVKDDEVIFSNDIINTTSDLLDKSALSVKSIIEFANSVNVNLVEPMLRQQIEMNSAISNEGLHGNYGTQIGKTLLTVFGDNVYTRAKARAAAGSDARMSGCSLPVVIILEAETKA